MPKLLHEVLDIRAGQTVESLEAESCIFGYTRASKLWGDQSPKVFQLIKGLQVQQLCDILRWPLLGSTLELPELNLADRDIRHASYSNLN